ncbi:double-strand break repair protein AddB [Novosphingobium sp. KCTC 2891]|uniref:double-strand break repair protein AddB n=1 Tax=Novosphingobium sp. KCTC 2891 TaxID=2989730 RepID=UPI002223E279|nr:double-strand break repair protein AddB [Novosphingobium sp. KCTC 2891]MCW1384831.1 double-strand break repair protein AddB [Novosphingobium sp. KCTC 2891]
MVDHKPSVYSIAAHRGFADALVAGLIPRYREEGFGLARLTLLLPSRRAIRTVTEAFVRASADGGRGGLLLPRMAVVGDLDLDETLGPLLDPIGAGADIPAAADPVVRLLRVADMLREELADKAPGEAGLVRQARSLVQSMDRLSVEGVAPEKLLDDDLIGLVGELSEHWKDSTRLFARVLFRWRAELEARGQVDAPERRNLLLGHAAARWREAPPPHPVVAAGVTSASPAVARLLRVVADLPHGAVILPDLDLSLAREVWDALGVAGAPEEPGGPAFGRGDVATHPQYHLKLLLNRMGIARDEVMPWHRAGLAAAPPERSRAISNLFLPPEASAAWVGLPAEQRRLSGVRMMETAHPEEEAQAIAVLVREALAVPERRVAVITPDRSLANRVVGHLARWNIGADDTAGRPLPQTPAGRVLLQIAEVWAERAAPVPLLALLGHPLVRGDRRAQWLERVRELDLVLRGPRPGPGVEAVRDAVRAKQKGYPRLPGWWDEVEALLVPMLLVHEPLPLGAALAMLSETAEALCGESVWAQADGRSLSAFVEQWSEAAGEAGLLVDPVELPALLRDAMEEVAVRPPYGGHPRLAIYGLLEARMSRADLVICAGLTEGSWPAAPAPDPLLAPPVLRALGIPGADFRIGLSAHDLAAALGAPEVVLSHAQRDAAGPAIPSRFLLRIRAMLGRELKHETDAPSHARALDDAPLATPATRPEPMPSAEQRKVAIAVTALDRLRGDPYQFYASAIMGLRSLDPLDADPTPAWRGTAVHKILEDWHKAGAPPGELIPLAEKALAEMSAHPFMRALWQPRLLAALAWIEAEQDTLLGQGRQVIAFETKGEVLVDGVRIHGRADRIDRCGDGTLAVIDYKTGTPPSGRMVEQGFALQLGLIGLIAEMGGFMDVDGTPNAFEYWSLARNKERGFGYRSEPVLEGKKQSGIPREDFLPETLRFLKEAIARWILGSDPFTARLNPDLPGYSDYDQLMRLDEWQGRSLKGGQG